MVKSTTKEELLSLRRYSLLKSWKHGMGCIGRDLKAHPASTATMGRAASHQLRLPRAPSNLVLTPPETGHPQPLWAACKHSGIEERICIFIPLSCGRFEFS